MRLGSRSSLLLSSCLILQVKLGSERVVTLEALRGSVRPVIVSGSKGQVSRAVKNAAPYIESLRQRGISVIPLPVNDVDSSTKLAALKESFRSVTELRAIYGIVYVVPKKIPAPSVWVQAIEVR